jgi:ComF family protein
VRRKIASISQWLQIPAVCVLCYHYHFDNCAICEGCEHLLLRLGPCCSICRLPLVDSLFLQCGFCIKNKPAFDTVLTTYCFEEPLRTLLHDFKYKNALYLRTFLVKLMLEALPNLDYRPDCLIPVPMHSHRLRHRGFNQAAELAKLLAKKCNIPLDVSLCEKKINTVPQVHLDRTHRRSNLKGSFSVRPSTYQHVALIDDLITTGNTANELARLLKEQGVARVDVWCVARTPSV